MNVHARSLPWQCGGAQLPIVPQPYPALIPAADMRRIQHLAAAELAADPLLGSLDAFGKAVTAGLTPGPSLLLEDHSGITLFATQGGNSALAYRALMLAGDGDIVAVQAPRYPDFEDYVRDVLRLGACQVMAAQGRARSSGLADECYQDPGLLHHVIKRARTAGGLNVIPYMGTGSVWRLAAAIAEGSGTRVHVAAPPPRLTRQVNDKVWFTRVASKLLGAQAVPETSAVFGMAALTGRLAALSRQHATVAVKLPSSASSSGNLVLASMDLAGLGMRELRDHVAEPLVHLGWQGEFPLLVTVWEGPLVCSPSAQLWIPPAGQGAPAVEGIFDQIVIGTICRFSGAVPSTLPMDMKQHMAEQALRLGALFQALGYVGRCSFDAIVIGQGAGTCLHWVECNGRWGGVSIPMTLANRLEGHRAHCPLVIMERRLPGQGMASMQALLDALGPMLYRPLDSPSGAIVLSPSFLHGSRRLALMVVGHDSEHALHTAQALFEALAAQGA